ncbi:hypothetical protein LEP1GSC162_2816 [Leptospira santarosai str. CBC1531]|nr:hypothetical protein LEP1GSC162_2816 [Leptospira santarosai str. CBC1531]
MKFTLVRGVSILQVISKISGNGRIGIFNKSSSQNLAIFTLLRVFIRNLLVLGQVQR